MERPLAFVVGCPRSGTSWVRNIVDAHPDVHAGPESHLFSTIHDAVRGGGADPWGHVLARYDERAAHPNVGLHRWIGRDDFVAAVERVRSSGGVDPLAAADDLGAHVISHYAGRHRLPVTTMLAEKTPNHLFDAARILDRFAAAVIVEVRRDGRDVCVSMERRATRVSWPPRRRADQITTWTRAIEHGLALCADPRYASRWLVVRYEDLLVDRHAQISRLLTFLRRDIDEELVARIVESTDIGRVAVVGDGEHVRHGVAGDWQSFFSAADVAEFDLLAGDVFRRADYR